MTQKAQRRKVRKKRQNSGGGGGNGGFATTFPALPESAPAATPPSAAPTPSGGIGDELGGMADNDFLNYLAQERPQEFFGTQMKQAGQLTGSGPALYENWLQNQFYNQNYLDYATARRNDPRMRWDQYTAQQGGPEGLAAKGRNQYNALTAFQRGQEYNPFAAGQGHFAFYG